MNILRLSTLSLTLAIAVMTLGYANSSFAGPDCDKHPNHASCGGGGSKTKFTVELQMGTVGGVVTTAACEGLSSGGDRLSARFPGDFTATPTRIGCAEFVMTDGTNIDAKVHLFSIAVTRQNSRVILFFTSEPSQQFPDNTFVYQTDRLVGVPGPDGTSFQIAVNEPIVPLTKIGQPDKGEFVGNIKIGRILYTAIP